MKYVDVQSSEYIDKTPSDKTIPIFTSNKFQQEEFIITDVLLHQYITRHDPNLGPYSIITSHIITNKGELEMLYDQGFRGKDALEKTADFITSTLGISGIILRSIISLRGYLLDNQKTS
jgi:hypothetical protein